jgi:hypothetical protein
MPNKPAGFVKTMDCLPVSKLPEGPKWTYEIKLDGYRLEGAGAGHLPPLVASVSAAAHPTASRCGRLLGRGTVKALPIGELP